MGPAWDLKSPKYKRLVWSCQVIVWVWGHKVVGVKSFGENMSRFFGPVWYLLLTITKQHPPPLMPLQTHECRASFIVRHSPPPRKQQHMALNIRILKHTQHCARVFNVYNCIVSLFIDLFWILYAFKEGCKWHFGRFTRLRWYKTPTISAGQFLTRRISVTSETFRDKGRSL